MKELKLILVFLLSITIQAQIRFEQGYLIDNNNQKQVVLIKNVDWLNNPKSIEYKNNETSKVEIATINQIKEFGIDNQSKYVRADIKIDRSSEDLDKISSNEEPDFKEEKLFLKVLIEGDASLYGYNDYNLKRFFYKTNTGDIEQLVYKKYEVSTNQFAYNRTFRGQIAQNFKCESISNDRIKKVNYRESELIKLFTEINICKGSDLTFTKESKKVDFNLWVRPRLNNSKLNISTDTESAKLGNKTGFGLGIEAEFILPFNKKKWSLIVEPSYQGYKVKGTKLTSGDIVDVDYKNIEIPFGVRHYFFLNQDSKLFINLQYMINLNLDSSIQFKRGEYTYWDYKINSRGNVATGIGYNFKDKFNVEVRYLTDRKLLDELNVNTKYSTISFVLGYNIF
ncbi:outer membrane beta-barrel protein [Empedobacter sp. UBA7248]|uniref:outer membrane beta-barrel protein n=1 Tax=Empedobacter sp. UBA7248 TaxID=1946448 RepID=UPI0025C6DFF4|nr:outer membrane beta-barrel protein [Empedobacter sp. UBA7248]